MDYPIPPDEPTPAPPPEPPVSAIPEGTHTVTPHLVVRGAARAIDFYCDAFGAIEIYRMPAPDGTVVHAELQLGDSRVYLADEAPAMGAKSPKAYKGTPVTIHLYVEDADAAFERAVRAGASVVQPVEDQFWGDRYGQVVDPFGHVWSIATHKEDVPPGEMMRRAEELFASLPPAPPAPARKKATVRKKPKKKVAKRKVAKKKPARKKKAVKKKPARRKKAAKKKAVRKKKATRSPARKKKATRKKKVARKKPARRKVTRKKPARKKKATRKKKSGKKRR
jgi:PhnB protein